MSDIRLSERHHGLTSTNRPVREPVRFTPWTVCYAEPVLLVRACSYRLALTAGLDQHETVAAAVDHSAASLQGIHAHRLNHLSHATVEAPL